MFANEGSERWLALTLGWGVDLGVRQRHASKMMRRRLAQVQEDQQKVLGRLTAQTSSIERERETRERLHADAQQCFLQGLRPRSPTASENVMG